MKKRTKVKEGEKKPTQSLYENAECMFAPFTDNFNYTSCTTFQEQFKNKIEENEPIPINSPHMIDQLENSFMDLELL